LQLRGSLITEETAVMSGPKYEDGIGAYREAFAIFAY
jgi:hypothetical protein